MRSLMLSAVLAIAACTPPAGGYAVAFNLTGLTPPALLGAVGMWSTATAGLVVAAVGMCGFLAWMIRSQRPVDPSARSR